MSFYNDWIMELHWEEGHVAFAVVRMDSMHVMHCQLTWGWPSSITFSLSLSSLCVLGRDFAYFSFEEGWSKFQFQRKNLVFFTNSCSIHWIFFLTYPDPRGWWRWARNRFACSGPYLWKPLPDLLLRASYQPSAPACTDHILNYNIFVFVRR